MLFTIALQCSLDECMLCSRFIFFPLFLLSLCVVSWWSRRDGGISPAHFGLSRTFQSMRDVLDGDVLTLPSAADESITDFIHPTDSMRHLFRTAMANLEANWGKRRGYGFSDVYYL